MGLVFDLTIVLVTKPFSLFKFVCVCGVRTVCLVSEIWMQLVKAIIDFHVDICWRIMVWVIALLSLPARILTALQRERLLEMDFLELQTQLECLAWDKIELEEHLQISIEDRTILESVLVEFEEEHDKFISKIELLKNELQDLKDENSRLKEMQRKGQNVHDVKDHGIPMLGEYGVPPWSSEYNGSKVFLKDLLMHKDAWENQNRGKTRSPDFLETGSKARGPMYEFPPWIISRNQMVDEVLEQHREVALSQSLFSAILSLLVGIIIWEAEDPCMPLVVALFIVVGISLKSVVQFFSTIKNRPATYAVALLSFNWFILGVLSYPTLPMIANISTPLALTLVNRVVFWLGLSSSA